jgi:hypothetical protein
MADVAIVLAARGRDARGLQSPCLRGDDDPEPVTAETASANAASPNRVAGRATCVERVNDPRTFIPEPTVVGPGEAP